MTFLFVFLCAVCVDLFYTRWVLNVGEGKKLRAALASMGIGAASLAGLTSVVADKWMAIPYLLGLGAGTVLGMVKL